MRWTIEGADASKGHDVRLTIEAETREQAETQARYNGILVSAIVPEAQDQEPAAASSMLEYAKPATRVPDSAPPAKPRLAYFAGDQRIPQYRQILVGARWLKWFGWICIGLGILNWISGVFQNTDIFFRPRFNPVRLIRLVETFWFGAALTGTGLFFHIFSNVALALRDMARNSFQRKTEDRA